ncbi:hypothetical protein EVA_19998 [gut metagenome]|uniref:Uncharacterized protein n=1 Tax=gut metagenome TaxID=749906 RepID=J9BWE5_9ZZZZ
MLVLYQKLAVTSRRERFASLRQLKRVSLMRIAICR